MLYHERVFTAGSVFGHEGLYCDWIDRIHDAKVEAPGAVVLALDRGTYVRQEVSATRLCVEAGGK